MEIAAYHLSRGAWAAADQRLRAVLAQDPRKLEAWLGLAEVAIGIGRSDQLAALAGLAFDQQARGDSRAALAFASRLQEYGLPLPALRMARMAVRLATPIDTAEAREAAAFVARLNDQAGFFHRAAAWLRRLARVTGEAVFWRDFALAAHRAGLPGPAAAAARRALMLIPGDFDCWHLLAAIAVTEVDVDAGSTTARRAMQAATTPAQRGLAAATAAYAQYLAANFDAAVTVTDEVMIDAAASPELRAQRAVALFGAGRWAEGFADFEWRWRLPGYRYPAHDGAMAWARARPGSPLVMAAEQGFGDTIQFARYLPLAARRHAGVTCLVPRPLARLFAQSFPDIAVETAEVGSGPAGSVGLMSAPALLDLYPPDIPGHDGYLVALPEEVAGWRTRLGPGGMTIGLCWSANPRHGQAAGVRADALRRSLPVATLAPWCDIPGLRFVSLQLGAPDADVARRLGVLDPTDDLRDFADTAALMGALDLVISVDTAVAHLAGALGRPVWLLDRHDANWRWLPRDSDRSVWYRSMRLFRQARTGDWSDVVAAVGQALRTHR